MTRKKMKWRHRGGSGGGGGGRGGAISSQIGCRGGAEAEQHHQRGAAGVASRRGWNGSAEPSLGAQVKRQHKQGGRAGGAAAERSPRLASLASGQG